MSDNIQDYTVTCQGGLDNKNTYLEISSQTPGAATRLINFEPGLYGGYRRIEGFTLLSDTYGLVDSVNAEGPVLGVFIYDDEIYAARKQTSGSTYKIYRFDSGSGWVAQSPGFTLNTTDGTYTVSRISYDTLNFDGMEVLVFVDGVNYAYMFDGTNWAQIQSSNSGANFANAGGTAALDQPSLVAVYQNHLFLSGDPTAPHAVAHSAPQKHYDFVVANGAGQVVPGYSVNQIKVWRNDLITFARERIGRIFVSGSDFVYRDITTNLGCISPLSVIEVNGDLMYLSQDGFRAIAGTDRIDDFELNTLSKKIQKTVQELSNTYTNADVTSVAIKQKSQVRFFFNSSGVETADTRGIIGGFRNKIDGSNSWEWGELLGIQSWVVTSGPVSGTEYIIHGDYDGYVFRQEQGNDFNGAVISAIYRTPYLDFGEPMIRKSFRQLHAFIEPEGEVDISTTVSFDWRDPDVAIPDGFVLEADTSNAAIYGNTGAKYGATGIIYGGGLFPVLDQYMTGSGRSIQLTFSTSGTEAPYAIQTLVYEFIPQGRR